MKSDETLIECEDRRRFHGLAFSWKVWGQPWKPLYPSLNTIQAHYCWVNLLGRQQVKDVALYDVESSTANSLVWCMKRVMTFQVQFETSLGLESCTTCFNWTHHLKRSCMQFLVCVKIIYCGESTFTAFYSALQQILLCNYPYLSPHNACSMQFLLLSITTWSWVLFE